MKKKEDLMINCFLTWTSILEEQQSKLKEKEEGSKN